VLHDLPFLDSSGDPSNLFSKLHHYAFESLIICLKVVNLCWGRQQNRQGVQARSPSGPSFVEQWNSLLQILERWYKNRPEEFLPTFEREASQGSTSSEGRTFPIITLSNGASTLGNQLHHTAMLILLLNKPRTVRLWSVSSYTSLLWHAERLCGIALNNNRRECWDPCLLASLVLAAGRMTHESQQRALTVGFDRIQKLTGFNLTDILADLYQSWSYSGGI